MKMDSLDSLTYGAVRGRRLVTASYSIYTDIRKLQVKAKTSYTLITEEVEVLI